MAARGDTSDNQPAQDMPTGTGAPRAEERDLFPVVAIGASAGGFRALQSLFRSLAADTGMAYVVILHLARDYSSNLAQLLSQCTAMPVKNASKGMPVEPNQVYVIPPNKTLALAGRNLRVTTREQAPGKFKPIDQFFESLAEQRQDKAIGIVLSGTGTDGVLGVQAIKAAGGITFAQSEESAEFSEMPHNAVKTGQVDLVRDVEGISRELDSLKRHSQFKIPADHFPETSNEELQSINEEIETAKEELESSNEELSTVNQELQTRNEELSQAHNDLHNLILSAQIPFLIVSGDLKIRRVSPNGDKSLNISDKDVGRPLSDFNLSFELPDLEKTLLKVIRDNQEVEYEIQDQAGVWNLLRIRPYRIEQTGAVEGAVLTLLDIDRIKRSMEEIEKAHKYALRIVDSVKNPLLVLDEDLVCRTANPAFYQKFQVSPYETEGRKLFELGAGQWNQPKLRRLLEDILPHSTRMDDYQVEFDFPHIGPRIMMLSARRMEAASAHRETILLGVEDVTDQKLVEKYLRQAKQEAEKASLAKSEFLATISHEVRSPLTVIVSALEFLKQTKLDQQQEKCLELAETSSGVLLQLLEDLLDFSKIEAGKIDLNLKPMAVRQLVDDIGERYRHKALGRGVEFTLHIDQAVPPTLLGDSKYLTQILANLIGNAVKFTHQGRIDLEVRLADMEPPAGGGRCLLFAVRDTGIGIPSDQIELMFERFTQKDSSSTREYGGTGLGLAICKRLVEYMGGTIWAESQPGEGSAFFFTVPLRETGQLAPTATGPPREQPVTPAALLDQTGPARILVAEDDPSIRHMLGVVLKNWGWQMVVAENGAQVQEKFRTEKPSLVLMDLQMPDMDGLQATRELREQNQIPIIGLTAHAGPEHRDAGLAAGMNAVIIKPFSMNELKTTLETYLRAETDN